MDWFLYDNGLRHEKVKVFKSLLVPQQITLKKAYHWKTFFNNFSAYSEDDDTSQDWTF